MLFKASSQCAVQQFSHITLVLESMPKPLAFFNPICLKASPNDQVLTISCHAMLTNFL
jgi:hypothetical protein